MERARPTNCGWLCFWLCMASATYASANVMTAAGVGGAGTTTTTTQNALLATAGKQELTANSKQLPVCSRMLRHVFENATPRDEQQAGVFEEYKPEVGQVLDEETYLWSCLEACCEKSQSQNRSQTNSCNVVLVFKRKCYHIHCVSNEACLPKSLARERENEKVQMVLVNPVDGDQPETWTQLLKATKQNAAMLPYESELNFWKQPHRLPFQDSNAYDDDEFPMAEKRMKQLLLQPPDENDEDLSYYGGAELPSNAKFMTCDLDTPCPPQEECVPLQANAVTGLCSCKHGFIRNKQHKCIMPAVPYSAYLPNEASALVTQEAAGSEIVPEVVAQPPVKQEVNKVTVSVMSKEVQLPEQEVTLAAFTVPDEETSGAKYKYLWTLISQPKGPMNGTISDQSKSKVKLSNLSAGLYTFKVTVTGDNGTFGEAAANVTVLPERRINQAPQVIISPSEQTIRQPTSNAVLDGSTSTDDDKIVNWHWEVILGPLGYQPQLPEVNTLQLDLTSPGNYTFKLTVTDSNNVTNSTTATIQVLKETDYAPVANAGDAVILYLPNNNVTLNGTASSDDHEIVEWEWTKDASDEAKAVDMQNTRTPYVQLSNLEEGMYTFVLKVTDGSKQSSTAKVHVFVKPPTNSPPTAKAGANVTTSLPINWATLNGSESKDDIGIKSYQWKQLSGPNKALILKSNSSIANATSLTLGLYEFELSVADENNNTATDSTWVKIVQERNAAPIANAGGDRTIALPVTAIYLNGSQSSDDLAVVKYVWTREDTSQAAGVIVGDTDKQPIMILSNVVQGRYVFKLTVSDDQGLTGTDSVSINVHADPMLMNLVQITLPMGLSVVTKSELDSTVQKLQLLLGDDNKIQIRELKQDLHTEAAVLEFFVMTNNAKGGQSKPMDGLHVERMLRAKLQKDDSILGALYVDIRTTVCQNNCSGHGRCEPSTRACICEAFWMPSVGFFFSNDEANCDWSILYVFVGVISSCLLLSGIFWGIACACRQTKKPRMRQKVQKYALIGTQDEEAANYSRNTSLTESETDSDVLFETRSKSNGIGKRKANHSSSHGSGSGGREGNKYAVTKLGRKIKT
ncbi:dyslexia-associated protein KIAA0319-like protein [Drosophila novamexicana]|uniref:dyslexia-associated protein KIAA0319-like protein n=1 Tax=Drosophila novamexicana TaxID=47314 RepID=UPI0011E5F651|nr:dyslexia-associated protein KIAA0319-like protein [Drosophila novamexicana]